MIESFVSSDPSAWVILPLLIFSARIYDVTLGTIRVIIISEVVNYLTPISGFLK